MTRQPFVTSDAPEEDESSSESSSSSSDSDLEKEVCTDDVTSSTDSPDSQLSDLDTDSDYDSMTEENSFMATEIPQTPSIGTRVPGGAYVDPYTLGYAGDAPANDLSRTSTVGSGSGTPQPIAPVIRSISQGHDFPPVRAVPLSLKFGMEIFQRNDSQSQSIRTIQIKIRMAEGTPEFDVRENYVGRLLSKEPSVKKPFPKSMNGLYWKDFVVPGPPGDIDLLSPSELLCFYPLEDFRSALGTSLALGTQIAAAPVYNRQLRSVLLFGEPYECPSPISNILYTHGIDVIYYTHVPGKNL
ncbi:hypothetical protein SARC_05017 [Sphaeroforma arctica JP610]|uniref:Uncharacterized protein n=1 Tax=Sphaeroforma arctica JP610 TaxID=667725 RepID=A0A0L0G1J2_9EUKA|nr:hypothetical protein SARC_05017 [Sphaeroforma arctica JP610]KNC82699.1 hypothetical protein SARC_05017 [Sphaeroforma arctica JP610]|eukprot:XP_014156601.1 hypothetical protein SARC_05017 [Sphaeroforma arctica JP610]